MFIGFDKTWWENNNREVINIGLAFFDNQDILIKGIQNINLLSVEITKQWGDKNNAFVPYFCNDTMTFTVYAKSLEDQEITDLYENSSYIDANFFEDDAIINYGRWYIAERQLNKQTGDITFTCYNIPIELLDTSENRINRQETNVNNLLDEIEATYKIDLFSDERDRINLTDVGDWSKSCSTLRNLISYIVGYEGYSLRQTNRYKNVQGQVERPIYELFRPSPTASFVVDYTVPIDLVYENSFEVEPLQTIKFVHVYNGSGFDEWHYADDYEDGNYGVDIYNPFADEYIKWEYYLEKNYFPIKLKWFGNPGIQEGDLIEVFDLEGNRFYFPVLNSVMKMDGGFTQTLESYVRDMSQVSPIQTTVAKEISSIKNHFYADDNGVHVVELQNNSETGNNVLINGQGLNIRKDTTTVARFGETVQVGEDDSSHIEISNENINLYGINNEKLGNIGLGATKERLISEQINEDIPETKLELIHELSYTPIGDGEGNICTLEFLFNPYNLEQGTRDSITITSYDTWVTSNKSLAKAKLDEETNTLTVQVESSAITTYTNYVVACDYYYEGSAPVYDFSTGSPLNPRKEISGTYAFATGEDLINKGDYSQAFGKGNSIQANVENSAVFGSSNSIDDNYWNANGVSSAFATGWGNEVQSSYSSALGSGLKVIGPSQTVVGRYNVEDANEDYLFIVGNGYYNARSNAFTVNNNGNVTAKGTVSGTNITAMTERLNNISTYKTLATTTKNLANNTNVVFGSITFPANSRWIIQGGIGFPKGSANNSTGFVTITEGTTTSSRPYESQSCQIDTYTSHTANAVAIRNFTTETTLNLVGWQNTGSTLNSCTGYMIGMRIK